MKTLLALAAGLVPCAIALRILEANAARLCLIDQPVGHKAHTHPTPAVGGLGITITLVLCAGLAPSAAETLWLYLGILCLVTLGAIDDAFHLSARLKLQVMLVVFSAILWFSGNQIQHLGELWPGVDVTTQAVAFPMTLFAAIGVVNAFNLIDGMDGLAGSVTACILSAFLVLAWLVGAHLWMPFIALCLGAALGFLAFNLRLPGRARARIFMGDAGSLVIGLILFWLSVSLSHRADAAAPPIVMVWLLAFPMLDTIATMILRIREGKSVFSAGHDHFHHLLQRAGMSVSHIVLVAVAITGTFAVTGLALWQLEVPDWLSLLLFLVATVSYVAHFLAAWKRLGRLPHSRRPGFMHKPSEPIQEDSMRGRANAP